MFMKSLTALALITLVTTTGYAQRGGLPPRGPGHEGVARMTEELQLTETQASQFAAIMQDIRAQHAALQTGGREEYCAIRAEAHLRIAEILTAEQFAQFETLRNEHGANPGNRRGQGRMDRHGQRPPLDCPDLAPSSEPENQSS